jgi:hypothetical protein
MKDEGSSMQKSHFEDHNSCYSCQDFDKCREASEQAEIDKQSN